MQMIKVTVFLVSENMIYRRSLHRAIRRADVQSIQAILFHSSVFMCLYLYVYLYLYVFQCVFVCVFIFVSVCICMSICVFMCICKEQLAELMCNQSKPYFFLLLCNIENYLYVYICICIFLCISICKLQLKVQADVINQNLLLSNIEKWWHKLSSFPLTLCSNCLSPSRLSIKSIPPWSFKLWITQTFFHF